jgi:hypothetical protein
VQFAATMVLFLSSALASCTTSNTVATAPLSKYACVDQQQQCKPRSTVWEEEEEEEEDQRVLGF